MRKFIFAVAISLVLAGCATQQSPTPIQVETADYGTLPADYKKQIYAYCSFALKDPYSARYTFMSPYKGYLEEGSKLSSKYKVTFGWVVPVWVNAKNGYGAYMGKRKVLFVFSEGKIRNSSINKSFGKVTPVI
ncbi:hypothetical protein [Dickeya poaceiphila]|uniref:Lipoprotein n=1 Tax=Dickeya poaceiphila TaxID=568768 RepID=A0A5B8HMU1_9GAMM|nr:hypothetical protein [Dickeya poaceiphila]QDX30169.1 hypothetical protein Dpoa569_0002035 [Dickeya poaceiphila]